MSAMMTADPNHDLDLNGKRVLITGVLGGIGHSTAEHLAALGATVYGTDHDVTAATRLPMLAEYRGFDLADDQHLAALVDWIAEIRPDVFVNNAAIFDLGSVLDADLAQYDRLFTVNVRAFYALMQAAARSMVAQGQRGSIINFSSQAGHRGEALVAHYCATKAAVISYTQSAALALAPHGIRVNSIMPGIMSTPPVYALPDKVFHVLNDSVPFPKRLGKPEEYASLVLELVRNSYFNGQNIRLDGAVRMPPR